MEYVSCFLLEHAITLDRSNDVKPCCTGKSADNQIFWLRNYTGGFFDADKFIENRSKYIEMMKSGNMPEQCRGCFNLEKKNWDDEKFVELVIIANESKCSCRCFYCNFEEDKEYFNSRTSYNVMPVLKTLKEKNLLRNTIFDVVGGECTEYPAGRLEEIIDFALKNDCFLQFFSAGIKFSEAIAQALAASKANLCVSIDSGVKETYEKIKRVKAYDTVWGNMERYCSRAVIDKNIKRGYVIIKYIIIPGINDNLKELSAFIENVKKIGCKYVEINVEYKWWNKNGSGEMPPHFWQLLDYLEECRKDLIIEYFENAVYLWDKRMEQDKAYKGINPCRIKG